jgi:SAM-dependent methyltransferase
MEKLSTTTYEKHAVVQESCPGCLSDEVYILYELGGVPVHSVLLLETRDKALSYPTGDIALGFCNTCGFVSNYAFNPELHEYSERYESSQAFSPTFNRFSKELAELLVDRYGLHDKNIIEIGCGQGEFITVLAQIGKNHGVGFDPAYEGSRVYQTEQFSSDNIKVLKSGDEMVDMIHRESCKGCVTFVSDFYGGKPVTGNADFIFSKMTLEHIYNTSEFMKDIKDSLAAESDAVLFFQVPEITRILDELAFWDIYYEHCSYFAPVSLARLFDQSGFEVRDIWTDYDDQYLMIEAGAKRHGKSLHPALKNGIDQLRSKIYYFSENHMRKLDAWKTRLEEYGAEDKKTVVWGSSSKAVSFLTTLNIPFNELQYVVDINPYRQGSYMAGTGQEIVSPEFLKDYEPDVVIVMNPIYITEIRNQLKIMNINPEVITVNNI